jgi:creatinine amidohydrolase
MRLDDLNWMDVENYLKTDDRLMLVLGACEEHGYLSLLTDSKIPLALADTASEKTGVLVAPPLNFGVSPYFAHYPGTISLRLQTFLAVVEDLTRWVYAQGFKRLLFVNGHGGNSPAVTLLHELSNALPGLKADWYAWWTAPSVKAIMAEAGLEGYHANWEEAFAFCRVADLPEGSKPPVVSPRAILNAAETRQLYGDGVLGGRYQPDEGALQKMFAAAVADITAKLNFA